MAIYNIQQNTQQNIMSSFLFLKVSFSVLCKENNHLPRDWHKHLLDVFLCCLDISKTAKKMSRIDTQSRVLLSNTEMTSPFNNNTPCDTNTKWTSYNS